MNIWIDIENAPHVPLFNIIVKELKNRGHAVSVTLRDCQNSEELANEYKMEFTLFGRQSKSRIKIVKMFSILLRVARLTLWAMGKNIDMSVCHMSRAQSIASRLLKIPIINMFDYEFVNLSLVLSKKTILSVPEAIPVSNLCKNILKKINKIEKYPGFKELVYSKADNDVSEIKKNLRIEEDEIVVILRPPASKAHYHNPKSESLFISIIEYLGRGSNLKIIVLPRYEEQRNVLKSTLRDNKKFIIPEEQIKNEKLLGMADLLISGGGTMNREAVALNIPAYTYFSGKQGALDESMIRDNLIKKISSIQDIEKIKLIKYEGAKQKAAPGPLNFIIELIESELRS